MPEYQITHQTVYRHGAPAGGAWQMLQLQPRSEGTQECLDFQLELRPDAADLSRRTDYFGNTRHFFSVRETHTDMSIVSRAVVRRGDLQLPLPGVAPGLEEARRLNSEAIASGEAWQLEQFLCPSPLAPALPGTAELAAGLDPTLPVPEWLDALGHVFAETFTFDPRATDISTPLSHVLLHRRGVCQDFTHLFLSCVRQHRLPAAYVSGYLLTTPPPGQPRLRGADAMHAWASVYVPGAGWVDYDPTNCCFAGTGHIVVGRGRDYTDVSPTRGVFTGSYAPAMSIAVTVEPAA